MFNVLDSISVLVTFSSMFKTFLKGVNYEVKTEAFKALIYLN